MIVESPINYLILCVSIALSGCSVLGNQASVKTSFQKQNLVQGKPRQNVLHNDGFEPEMVTVPAGEFIMGSPESESDRYLNEGPQRKVTIAKPFLLGKTEVTVAQFKKFVAATGYKTDGERNTGSFVRDATAENGRWRLRADINWRMDHEGKPSLANNPVVHVSWNDTQAYLKWLSKETGKTYRLPSEAELEYANRAGSTGRYWWGDGIPDTPLANIRGEEDESVANPVTWDHTPAEYRAVLSDGYVPAVFEGYGDGYHGLAPVGQFSANPFGLYDTAGNVWEWTQDCWHGEFNGAPQDSSAWDGEKKCPARVVKGGSFYCFPRHVRSANRWGRWAEFRNMYIGFRVARDM